MKYTDICGRQVINVMDGSMIGLVNDVEFDPCTGQICQLIIPGQGKWGGLFGRDTEYTIGWKCVRQIGTDIVLVDVCMDEIVHPCDE